MPTYAEVDAGNFVSPHTTNGIQVHRAVIRRVVPYLNTTGQSTTAVEWTISGLEQFEGYFNGWMDAGFSTASGWGVDSGTLTFDTTTGLKVTGTGTIWNITMNYDLGATNRKVIPVLCRFRYTGAVAITAS